MLDKNLNKITCSILAGGKSSRFNGINKSLLKINETTIIENTTNISQSLFNETIIITNKPEDYNFLKNINTHSDIITDKGPLGGIYTSLYYSINDIVFVLAGDMPFIDKEIITTIVDYYYKIGKPDILIPRFKSGIEPLHAIYNKSILPKLKLFLENTQSLSIRSFFNKVDTKYLQLNDTVDNKNAFTNINSKDDFNNASS